jgi:hypothetical protein
MKSPQELAKAYLKKVLSDLHSHLVGLIVGAILLAIGSFVLFSENVWLYVKTTMQSPTPLWATIVLVLLVVIYMKMKKTQPTLEALPSGRLIPKFGVLWDKNKEPYCPFCEKLLSLSQRINNGESIILLRCLECQQMPDIMDDNANLLSLKEAKSRLK